MDLYTAWVASVRALGGVVTVFPSVVGSYEIPKGSPAARYTAAQVAALGLVQPDAVSADRMYSWFLPSWDVIDSFFGQSFEGSIAGSQDAIAKGALSLEPQWFRDLSKAAKAVTVIAVGAAVLYGLSYLPRRGRG